MDLTFNQQCVHLYPSLAHKQHLTPTLSFPGQAGVKAEQDNSVTVCVCVCGLWCYIISVVCPSAVRCDDILRWPLMFVFSHKASTDTPVVCDT